MGYVLIIATLNNLNEHKIYQPTYHLNFEEASKSMLEGVRDLLYFGQEMPHSNKGEGNIDLILRSISDSIKNSNETTFSYNISVSNRIQRDIAMQITKI